MSCHLAKPDRLVFSKAAGKVPATGSGDLTCSQSHFLQDSEVADPCVCFFIASIAELRGQEAALPQHQESLETPWRSPMGHLLRQASSSIPITLAFPFLA